MRHQQSTSLGAGGSATADRLRLRPVRICPDNEAYVGDRLNRRPHHPSRTCANCRRWDSSRSCIRRPPRRHVVAARTNHRLSHHIGICQTQPDRSADHRRCLLRCAWLALAYRRGAAQNSCPRLQHRRPQLGRNVLRPPESPRGKRGLVDHRKYPAYGKGRYAERPAVIAPLKIIQQLRRGRNPPRRGGSSKQHRRLQATSARRESNGQPSTSALSMISSNWPAISSAPSVSTSASRATRRTARASHAGAGAESGRGSDPQLARGSSEIASQQQ